MAARRKPISFDTTLRNPERIPQFISILNQFEGKVLDDEIALQLEAEIIRQKIFNPTRSTLGTYVKEYSSKFKFKADDLSQDAERKVEQYFEEWEKSQPGEIDIDKIIYLLKNTITAHKEKGWKGGWESRIHTQYNFLNELGFVRVVKGKSIMISENGKLMITEYSNGYPKDDHDETYEQTAFLNAFSKYQINNPYRQNTIKVNFFPLVLNVINYFNKEFDEFNSRGISRQDLPFIITWGNDDHVTLAKYIYNFRKKFGYNTSDETVYKYAMNLMDDSTSNDILAEASEEFIKSKKVDYKFDKITHETPDEVVRKLRLTMLISLRGHGRFIDINTNELQKVEHILNTYSENIEFNDNKHEYFKFMGHIDQKLVFDPQIPETQKAIDAKDQAINEWSKKEWSFLKKEIKCCTTKSASSDKTLELINKPVRMEFLTAAVVRKALPNVKIKANYKADDNGIPFRTASGNSQANIGADIDVFEGRAHVIVEPTISPTRTFQVEHELPSIRRHVYETYIKDKETEQDYDEWFAIFVAPNISKDVDDQVFLIKQHQNIEIYPWDVEKFVERSKSVMSIQDYKRDIQPQKMPKK